MRKPFSFSCAGEDEDEINMDVDSCCSLLSFNVLTAAVEVNYGLFVEEHHDAVGSVHPSLLHQLPLSDEYPQQCVFI